MAPCRGKQHINKVSAGYKLSMCMSSDLARTVLIFFQIDYTHSRSGLTRLTRGASESLRSLLERTKKTTVTYTLTLDDYIQNYNHISVRALNRLRLMCELHTCSTDFH